jgi:hypothetical protein
MRRPTGSETSRKPALIAWSRDDRFFKPEHARRLAKDLQNARLGMERARPQLVARGRAYAPRRADQGLRERPSAGVRIRASHARCWATEVADRVSGESILDRFSLTVLSASHAYISDRQVL